jgi:hypothetical protein
MRLIKATQEELFWWLWFISFTLAIVLDCKTFKEGKTARKVIFPKCCIKSSVETLKCRGISDYDCTFTELTQPRSPLTVKVGRAVCCVTQHSGSTQKKHGLRIGWVQIQLSFQAFTCLSTASPVRFIKCDLSCCLPSSWTGKQGYCIQLNKEAGYYRWRGSRVITYRWTRRQV